MPSHARMLRTLLLTGLALAALAPLAAAAQAGGDARLREALRAATTKAQALEAERAALQVSEAALRQELTQAREQLAAAEKAAARARQSTGLERRVAEQRDAAASAAEALTQCEASAAETARLASQERERLAGESAALAQRDARCRDSGEKLYRVGLEVLDWLDRLGFGAALAAREPFLGLKRVELENAAQDYRDRLLDARGTPGGTP